MRIENTALVLTLMALVAIFTSDLAQAQGVLPSTPAAIQARRDSGYVPLFNGKNFENLYTIIRGEGRNDNPDTGQKIFEVRNGMIFTQVGEGYIATAKQYDHYICRVEYKFGNKSVDKYHNGNPSWNSGFLYHIYDDQIWPRGMEYQLLRSDAGTIWTNPDENFKTTINGGVKQFKPASQGGVPYMTKGGDDRCIQKSGRFDKDTAWNVAVIKVHKDTAWHYMNGNLNNGAWDIRFKNTATGAMDLITHGGIGVQAEFSEMYFNAWEILELDDNGNPIKPVSLNQGLAPRQNKLLWRERPNLSLKVLSIDGRTHPGNLRSPVLSVLP